MQNSTKTYDCLATGIIVADHVCLPIERIPRAGELILTERMDLTTGGCATNVGVDLAKLGRKVAVVGKVGRDIFGRFVRESLEAAGVDSRHVVDSEHRETSGTLLINVRGEDRRFITSIGANGDFTGREITADLIHQSRILYLGGFCFSSSLDADIVAQVFQTARAAGVPTLLDVVIPAPGDYWPQLEKVLPYTDVFLPNQDEALLITGESDPVRQAERFRSAGVKTAVITCGGGGALLVSETERLRAGRYPVNFVDGTGSGDAFVAGYIHAMLSGQNQADSLRWGSALGASCVRAAGASTGVFTNAELTKFLSENSLEVTSELAA